MRDKSYETKRGTTEPHYPLSTAALVGGGVTHFPLRASDRWHWSPWDRPLCSPSSNFSLCVWDVLCTTAWMSVVPLVVPPNPHSHTTQYLGLRPPPTHRACHHDHAVINWNELADTSRSHRTCPCSPPPTPLEGGLASNRALRRALENADRPALNPQVEIAHRKLLTQGFRQGCPEEPRVCFVGQLPRTTNRQPPTANRHQPPRTATNRQPPTAANRHQPPPTANRQPSFNTVSVVSCLAHVLTMKQMVLANVRFCWRYPFLSFSLRTSLASGRSPITRTTHTDRFPGASGAHPQRPWR